MLNDARALRWRKLSLLLCQLQITGFRLWEYFLATHAAMLIRNARHEFLRFERCAIVSSVA